MTVHGTYIHISCVACNCRELFIPDGLGACQSIYGGSLWPTHLLIDWACSPPKQATNATTIAMRFNKSELNSLASNPATRFDKEGLLIVIDRQEGFLWRSEGKLTSNVQIHKPLSHPLDEKHTHPNPRLVTKRAL